MGGARLVGVLFRFLSLPRMALPRDKIGAGDGLNCYQATPFGIDAKR